jgi:hypothetical protein
MDHSTCVSFAVGPVPRNPYATLDSVLQDATATEQLMLFIEEETRREEESMEPPPTLQISLKKGSSDSIPLLSTTSTSTQQEWNEKRVPSVTETAIASIALDVTFYNITENLRTDKDAVFESLAEIYCRYVMNTGDASSGLVLCSSTKQMLAAVLRSGLSIVQQEVGSRLEGYFRRFQTSSWMKDGWHDYLSKRMTQFRLKPVNPRPGSEPTCNFPSRWLSSNRSSTSDLPNRTFSDGAGNTFRALKESRNGSPPSSGATSPPTSASASSSAPQGLPQHFFSSTPNQTKTVTVPIAYSTAPPVLMTVPNSSSSSTSASGATNTSSSPPTNWVGAKKGSGVRPSSAIGTQTTTRSTKHSPSIEDD